MKNLFNEKDKDELLQRLYELECDSLPKWGKMNAHQVVVHMSDPFRTAFGERPAQFNPGAFSKWPFNKLISQYLPWPKSAPTAPEFNPSVNGSQLIEFEYDKKELTDLVQRFYRHQNSTAFPIHPAFGKLNNNEWARLMWRHINHHLIQFGI